LILTPNSFNLASIHLNIISNLNLNIISTQTLKHQQRTQTPHKGLYVIYLFLLDFF